MEILQDEDFLGFMEKINKKDNSRYEIKENKIFLCSNRNNYE